MATRSSRPSRAPAWEGEFWVIEVRGVGVTQARRLSQVEEMARDLVAIMVPGDELVVEIKGGAEVAKDRAIDQ